MEKDLRLSTQVYPNLCEPGNQLIGTRIALPLPIYLPQVQPFSWEKLVTKATLGSQVNQQCTPSGSPADFQRHIALSNQHQQINAAMKEQIPYFSMLHTSPPFNMAFVRQTPVLASSPTEFLSLIPTFKSIIADNQENKEFSRHTQSLPAKTTYGATKIFHLRSLYNLVMKLFVEASEITPTELQLSEIEKALLINIIKRKFGIDPPNLNFNVMDTSDLTEMIIRARSQRSSKRIEERKKFVFKQAIKRLKQVFCRTSRIRFHPDNSQNFYYHYFGELVTSNSLNIEVFFDPLNPKLHNPVFKTLSNEYLRLLFKSPKFAADFLEFLEIKNFIPYCQQVYPAKIEKLLMRWEEELRKGVSPQTVLKDINQYFLQNRQCKLPWSCAEMEHAARSFIKFTKQSADR